MIVTMCSVAGMSVNVWFPLSCRSLDSVVATGSHVIAFPATSFAVIVSTADFVSSMRVADTVCGVVARADHRHRHPEFTFLTMVNDARPLPRVSWNVIVPWNGGPV